MINENVIRKTKLITVKVPQGSRATEFYFPDQPDLRGVALLGICFFVSRSTPKTYENNIVINDPATEVSFLTLYDMSGFAFVDKSPVCYFHGINTNNSNIWGTTFNGQKVNWSKCYLHIADAALISPVQDEYYMFLVSYEIPVKK